MRKYYHGCDKENNVGFDRSKDQKKSEARIKGNSLRTLQVNILNWVNMNIEQAKYEKVQLQYYILSMFSY